MQPHITEKYTLNTKLNLKEGPETLNISETNHPMSSGGHELSVLKWNS
jgi:hypothetical protein